MSDLKIDKKTMVGVFLVAVILSFALVMLLVNIFERKMESKESYVKLVNVTEETTDPAVWGNKFSSPI